MFQISDFARCHCNWSGYKPSTNLSLWQIYVIPLLIFQYPLNILLCMVYFIDLCISSSQSITQKISLTVFFTVWSLQIRTCSTKEQWGRGSPYRTYFPDKGGGSLLHWLRMQGCVPGTNVALVEWRWCRQQLPHQVWFGV